MQMVQYVIWSAVSTVKEHQGQYDMQNINERILNYMHTDITLEFKILYCKYYVVGHYPSSCLYLKTPSSLFFETQRFGDWIVSPSSDICPIWTPLSQQKWKNYNSVKCRLSGNICFSCVGTIRSVSSRQWWFLAWQFSGARPHTCRVLIN
jgi:hypothetical protein